MRLAQRLHLPLPLYYLAISLSLQAVLAQAQGPFLHNRLSPKEQSSIILNEMRDEYFESLERSGLAGGNRLLQSINNCPQGCDSCT